MAGIEFVQQLLEGQVGNYLVLAINEGVFASEIAFPGQLATAAFFRFRVGEFHPDAECHVLDQLGIPAIALIPVIPVHGLGGGEDDFFDKFIGRVRDFIGLRRSVDGIRRLRIFCARRYVLHGADATT